MSAYLATNDVFNALATYYHLKNISPHNRSSYELAIYEHITSDNPHMTEEQAGNTAHNIVNLDYELTYATNKTHTIAALVFDQLLKENKNSLKALYPNDPDMWANNYKFEECAIVNEWVLTQNVKGLASLASMLKGLIYQSCEHKGFKTSPAFYLLNEIKESLLNDIIKAQSFEREPWASWEQPKSNRFQIGLKTH